MAGLGGERAESTVQGCCEVACGNLVEYEHSEQVVQASYNVSACFVFSMVC